MLMTSAGSVRRDIMEAAAVAGSNVCPRWNCPCVSSQQQDLQLFTNKRPDSTSHFRRTTLAAAEKALLRTQNVLDRIVSNRRWQALTFVLRPS